MIMKDFFKDELSKLSHLTGNRITQEQCNALYDKLKHTEFVDFTEACNSLAYQDKRLNLPNLYSEIERFASVRREKENTSRQKQEHEEAIKFWQENKRYIEEGRCNRKCISCKVTYCDTIHTHSISAMKDIFEGIKTLDQVNLEMNQKFEGWKEGFIKEPF